MPLAFKLYCKVMWVGLCVFNQGEILDFGGNGLSSPCVKVPLSVVPFELDCVE